MPRKVPVAGLIGRYFAVLDEKNALISTGTVKAQITEHIWLVQYCEPLVFELDILGLIELTVMQGWLFFEDREHLLFWLEYQYRAPKTEK
jgi:hypothetical protein